MSAGIRAGSSNDGYVQVNGNDIITALSGGNVGIGVSNPSTKLHVNGTVTATNFAGAVTGTSSGNPTLTNGANNRIVTATGANALTGETNLQWDGETLYINRSSNTVEGLSISNSNNSQGSAAAQLNLSGGDNSYANIRLECNGTSHHIRQDGSGNLKFYNNTTDRVHITSAGKLSVKSSAANAIYLSLLDNNSSNEIWRVGQAADGDGYVELLEDGGTVGCKLDSSGNSFTMGNFGIGVASPSARFNLKLPSRGNAAFRITDSDTANDVLRAGSQADGDGFFQLRTIAGAGNVLLDASGVSYITGGNFGIGLTSPAKKLQVKEASSSSGVYYNAHIGGSSHLANYAVGIGFDPEGYTARTKIGIVAEGTADGYSRGKLHFLLDAANDSGEATLSESRMTILDSGKIGINQSSPDGMLHVFSASAGSVNTDADADELTLENSGNVGLSLLTASTGESSIYFGNPGTNGQKDGWIKYYHESHSTAANRRALTFKAGGGSEKMRLDSYGRLRIGGTNEAADGAFDDLIIGKHAAGTNVGISILCTDGQQGALGFAKSGTLADAYVAYVHNSTATNSVMTIKSSGTIQFNTSSSSNPQLQLNNAGNVYLRNSNELHLNNAGNTASCRLYCDGGARLRISSYSQDMLRMENAQSIIFLNNSEADTPYSISNVGRSVWTNKTRMNRSCYTRGGQIGEGGTTADATGNDGTHNPGAYLFQGNTPVRGSDSQYRFWIQSGDNYPHASNFIELNIKNSGFYRVTIKGSHSSATADMAMFLIYGLANSSGNLPPCVVRVDRSSTTSENGNTSGSFSTSVTGYGSSGANSTHDTTLKITYSGNNNQGLLAFIEEWF